MALFDGVKKYFGLKPQAKVEAAKMKDFGTREGVNEEDKKFLAKALGNHKPPVQTQMAKKKPVKKASAPAKTAKRKSVSKTTAKTKAKGRK